MFLHADIGQMDIHIVQLRDASIIFHSAKSTKALLKQIGLERTKRSDQHIKT